MKCYTRKNNAGENYITCDGGKGKKSKKTETGKAQRTGGAPTHPLPKKPKKGTRAHRLDVKIRQLDNRAWASGRGKAKNPHKWMKSKDGKTTTAQLKELVKDYGTDKFRAGENNSIIRDAAKKVLKDRGVKSL